MKHLGRQHAGDAHQQHDPFDQAGAEHGGGDRNQRGGEEMDEEVGFAAHAALRAAKGAAKPPDGAAAGLDQLRTVHRPTPVR